VVRNHNQPNGQFDEQYSGNGQASLSAQQHMVAVDDLEPSAVPLTVMSQNGTVPRARGGHRATPRRAIRPRRRWPIVTSALVVLLAVIVGGGFIAWHWSQDQYYVGASGGQVVIYRGLNERILGVSLSKQYEKTSVQLAQVPTNEQETVKDTDAASSLSGARSIVTTLGSGAETCRQGYNNLAAWVQKENQHVAAAAAATRAHHKPPADTSGPRPPLPGGCPPSTAYNIPVSAITVAAAGQT
jgi:hypothetical protein